MNNRTVLLVDDDALVVDVLQRALTQLGYIVLVASDGRLALSRFVEHANSIDLVITDLQMPDMGGQELAKRLRQERPHLPIVFISGDPDAEGTPMESDFPRHVLLRKPFLPSELVARLGQLLAP